MSNLDPSQFCTIKTVEVGIPVSRGTKAPGELVEGCDSDTAAEADIVETANKEGW
jgi:hypothetical protein